MGIAGDAFATAPPVPGTSLPRAVREAREQGLLPPAAVPETAAPERGAHATAQRLTEGPWNIPVLLVSFPGQDAAYPRDRFRTLLFDTLGANPHGSFSEYYRTVSRGILRPNGQVHGWYTMPKTRSYYAYSSFGLNRLSGPQNAAGLVQHAVAAADAEIDFSKFDRDADGEVDVVFVVHAGPGGEAVSGDPSQLWSITSSLSAGWNGISAYVTNDRRAGSTTQFMRVNRFCILPERSALRVDSLATIGVYCHEFGHALGWPDLYDASVLGGGLNLGPGDWCVMATGAYGGDDRSPERPTRPCAWALVDAGWVRVENLSLSGTTRFHPVDEDGVVYRLWWQGESSAEHFLIENRRARGTDETLPAEGLLVYRVESDVIASLRGSNRVNSGLVPGLRLEEADGRYDLLYGGTRGDAGDPYPGSTGTRRLADDTQPTSRSYSGRHTNVALEGIREDGDDLLAWVQLSPSGWSTPERHPLAARLRPASGRALARTGDHLHWIAHDDADSGRVVALRRAYGLVWGAGESVSSGPATDATWSDPAGGPLVALWAERRGGPPEIYYRRWSDPRGEERRATSSPGFATRPAAAWLGGGRLAVLWLDTRSGHSQIYSKIFRLGEEDAAAEVAVTDEELTPDVLDFVLASGPNGRLQLGYAARGSYGDELFWQQYVPDQGWTETQPLSPHDGLRSGNLDLAVAYDGSVLAVWRDIGVTRTQVQWLRADPLAGEPSHFPLPLFSTPLTLPDLRFAFGASFGSTVIVARASDSPFDRLLVAGDHPDAAWDIGFGWLGPGYEVAGSDVMVDVDARGVPTLVWTTPTASGSLLCTSSRAPAPSVPVSAPLPESGGGALVRVQPNPASAQVRLTLDGAPPGAVASVYAPDGRRVARRSLAGGEAWWDGRDESGGALGAGVYFVRAEDERGMALGAARKLVWLR